jgi:hypothetical protein
LFFSYKGVNSCSCYCHNFYNFWQERNNHYIDHELKNVVGTWMFNVRLWSNGGSNLLILLVIALVGFIKALATLI